MPPLRKRSGPSYAALSGFARGWPGRPGGTRPAQPDRARLGGARGELTRINRWRYSRPPTYPSRRVPVRPSEANPENERTRGETREEVLGPACAGPAQAARTQPGAAG